MYRSARHEHDMQIYWHRLHNVCRLARTLYQEIETGPPVSTGQASFIRHAAESIVRAEKLFVESAMSA